MFMILGHLGVWAGLYALAAFICFSQLAGLTRPAPLPRWEAMACVLLTATAVYSVDRVKLFSKWLDPADIAAQPERYAFLTRRTRAVRALAAVLLCCAAFAGFILNPLAPVLVLFAAASTVLYAPKPRRSLARVKDRLWLKNGYVAIGLASFSVSMALIARPSTSAGFDVFLFDLSSLPLAGIATAFVTVALRIFCDAALCDIDDEPTDRTFRTDTFATSLGSVRVWIWAGIGRLLIAFGLLFCRSLPFPARVCWSGAMLLGMAALWWRHPARIRDTVDIRFLPEAAMVTLALWLFPASNM